MTYKFQRGAAVLSGSITAEEGLDAGTAGVSDAGAIAGVTTVSGSGKFEMGSMALGGTDVTATAAELNYVDVTAGTSAVSKAMVLDSNGDIDSSGLRHLTANGDIAAATLSASSGLSGASITLGGTAVTSTAAELNLVDGALVGQPVSSKAVIYDGSGGVIGNGFNVFSAGNVTLFDTAGASTITIGAGTSTVEIAGNLTVQGTQTILNTTTMEVEDGNILIASGSSPANDHGITIGTTSPVTLKLGSGATILSSSVPVSASTYYGSGANLSGITADVAGGFSITGYNTDNYAADAIISTAGNKGLHAWASANVTASYTFDLSGSYSAGNIVIIKGHSATATYPITIRPNDNTTYGIDGDPSIVLESNNASVTLIYNGDGGNWTII